MPDRLKYEPVKPGSMSSPGVAERLTPQEIRLRQLAKERAGMPKSSKDEPATPGMSSLAELSKGIARLRGSR